MTATVTTLRARNRGALPDTRNRGTVGQKVSSVTPAIPADAAATTITVAMMLADDITLTVSEWIDPDYTICEAHCDVTTLAARLNDVAGSLNADTQYFGRLITRTDDVETTHTLHVAVQEVPTATTTRLLLTLSAYDTRAMVFVAAVDTDTLEG